VGGNQIPSCEEARMDRPLDRRMGRRLENSLDHSSTVRSADRGATPSLHCPDCGAPMRLLAMRPARSAHGSDAGRDEITYRCEVCSTNLQDCALAPAA
jgi:hypothetical protein